MVMRNIGAIKKIADFNSYLDSIGVSLPFDEEVNSGLDSPLAKPVSLYDRVIGNRFAILPMGEIEFQIGDEVRMLRKGDGVVIPPDTMHRAKTFSAPAVLLECFGPACKEEFLT